MNESPDDTVEDAVVVDEGAAVAVVRRDHA